jgi:hypothetical protein
MKSTTKLITAAIAGAASWSVAEYALHRFAMHEMRGRGLASREHLHHHADITYFSPTSKKALSAATTAAVAFPAGWATIGRRAATAFTGGMIGAYCVYEVTHRRIHTAPPRNAYGRWLRRSHLHHHFGNPMRNLGVMTPLWDRALGTYDDPGVVTVPRRMAPVWLLDERGEVRREHRDDYMVRGRARADSALARRDHDDAYANRPPSASGETPPELVALDAERAPAWTPDQSPPRQP